MDKEKLDELGELTMEILKYRLKDKENCPSTDIATALKLLKAYGWEPIVDSEEITEEDLKDAYDDLPYGPLKESQMK